jgi:hypothetical protein
MGRADRPRSAAVERGAQPYLFLSQSFDLWFPLEFKQGQFRVPGLGLQVLGTGYQVQVRVRGNIQVLNLCPNLNTRTRLPTAETRDLRPEKVSPANSPIFGFPCCYISPATRHLRLPPAT